MFDWNDLKYLLAVARQGSTIAGAKALGVSQSTVQRRLAELERRLGHALVLRKPSGYALTPLGQDLVPLAEAAAAAIDAFAQKAGGVASDGREIIRLTCPEPMVGRLRPLIDLFHERNPAYKVEFVASDRYLDLLKGEADIAFRSGDTDDRLVGRTVADSIWGVYASREYVERHGGLADVTELKRHAIVALDETLAGHRLMLWLEAVAPRCNVVSRSTSILGLVQAVKSGIGVAPLPMVIAEEAGLVKLFGPVQALTRTWKMLTHPALRNTPRISTFFDFIAHEKNAAKTIFG